MHGFQFRYPSIKMLSRTSAGQAQPPNWHSVISFIFKSPYLILNMSLSNKCCNTNICNTNDPTSIGLRGISSLSSLSLSFSTFTFHWATLKDYIILGYLPAFFTEADCSVELHSPRWQHWVRQDCAKSERTSYMHWKKGWPVTCLTPSLWVEICSNPEASGHKLLNFVLALSTKPKCVCI